MKKKVNARPATVTVKEEEVASLLEKAQYAATLYQDMTAIYRYLHG